MKKRFIFLFLLMTLLFSCTSCGNIQINFSKNPAVFSAGAEKMTDSQGRLVAIHALSNFSQFYTNLLGENYYQMEIAEGVTFEQYVREYYILNECETLLLLNHGATSAQKKFTDIETENLGKWADQVFTSMTETQKNYTGASWEDVYDLIRLYTVASRVIEDKISTKEIEVSDEESRVVDITVIRMADESTAVDVYRRLVNGENFMTLTKENTLDSVYDYSVSRSDLVEPIRDIVFSMSTGDISELIQYGNDYYVIRLTDSYNIQLSSQEKTNMLATREYNGWSDFLNDLKKNTAVQYSLEGYQKIQFSDPVFQENFDLFIYLK